MLESELITDAGLTPGEAKVYLALLELGASTAGPIIKRSGVARSFIYNLLGSLTEKGLVSSTLKGRHHHFQAAEPSRLLDFMIKRREELERSQDRISALLPELLRIQGQASSNTVGMYEGFKGIQTCFERYKERLKENDEYLCLGIIAHQDEKYHTYWQEHHEERIRQGIKCRMLFNSNTTEEILINRNSFKDAQARRMPTNIATPAWFFIYADRVGIFLQGTTPFAIEIQNMDVAHSFRQYFEDYWQRSQPFVATIVKRSDKRVASGKFKRKESGQSFKDAVRKE
jgi:sugar-specific transcriptional regulator TrmB